MPKLSKTYDSAAVEDAIRELQQKKGGLRATAKKYGIPKSTLLFRIKNPGHKESFGPKPILTVEEENILKNWIIDLARKGFPRKKDDLQDSVQKFLIDHPRPNPFKNSRPGDGWVRAFLKRHPDIVSRTSEGVTNASSCVSEKDIKKWFKEIHAYAESKQLLEVLNCPTRVFNGDETSFQICPSTGKVLAKKGDKNVYVVEKGGSKENLTVLFSFSASGSIAPPLLVYAYKRIPEKVAVSVPEGWGIAKSDNGWMTADIFFEYIANVFHPYLVKENIALPVIYFLDGHRTHLTYEVSKLCSELNIEIIALYPNATRILQPCDVAVFKPLKDAWRKAAREWCNEHINEVITKVNFAPILQGVVKNTIKPETLMNGFRACGLHPFNPNNIDFSKCLGKQNEANENEITGNNNDIDMKTINYSEFKSIIGNEKIKHFQLLAKGEALQIPVNEEFHMLMKIWNHFHTSYTTSNRNANESAENEVSSKNLQKNVEIPLEIVDSPNKIEIGTKSPEKCMENMIPVPVNPPVKSSPAFKIISNTLLGNFLVSPKTPERKDKKKTERFPFAITSDKYKAMFKAKREQKQKLEDDKIDRRRKREEKKASDKENRCIKLKGSKNSDSSRIKDVKRNIVLSGGCEGQASSTNSCHKCNFPVIGKNGRIVCEECKCLFHRICIPKKHQIHVPHDAEDSFLCHNCFHESEEDDEDTEEEDDESIDTLYTQYEEYYRRN